MAKTPHCPTAAPLPWCQAHPLGIPLGVQVDSFTLPQKRRIRSFQHP